MNGITDAKNRAQEWNFKSVSYWLTAGGGLFVLFLGVNGMARPVAAADAFGLPLKDAADRDYVRVKADRDIAAGLTIFALLALKMRRASQVLFLVQAVEPVIDATLVATTSKLSTTTKLQRLPIHLGALAYVLLTVFTLKGRG